MATLRAFLDSRRVTSTAWNLTGMGNGTRGWLGKYYVAPDDYPTFLDLHTAHIAGGGTSTLLERHLPTGGPILIDLDFRYESDLGGTRAFTQRDLRRFIVGYETTLRELTGYSGALRAFVMLKPAPGDRKDGVHIVWPDVSVPYEVQFAVREAVLARGLIEACFGYACGVPADILDKSVIQRNNWFLYGATKPDAVAAYRVVECVGAGCDGAWPESDAELTRLFSLQLGRDVMTAGLDVLVIKKPVTVSSVASEPKKVVASSAASTAETVISHVYESELANDNRLHPLLLKIPAARWDNYSDWLTIGMALFNEGCSVELWDKMSQTADTTGKYTAGECAKKWASFRRDADRKVTARTLMSWVPAEAADSGRELINDLYACRKYVELMGDEVHLEDDDVYVFDHSTGFWKSDKKTIIATVQRNSTKLVFTTTGEDGKRKQYDYGGPIHNITNMLAHLPSLLRDRRFISRNLETALGYLLFEDGIFHIPTKTFSGEFDKSKVFTVNIKRPFPATRNPALEAEINERLFVAPFQNAAVGQYLKARLARSIAGCFRDKKFLCALGDADSSKGTITEALRHAFGDYVVSWNANYLKYNGHCGADEAKRLSWLFPLLNARLAISNECRMDGTAIDGNLLKTLSSGGDVITARQNFKDETNVVLRASFVYMGNDMPEITPKDSGIQTRVRMVRFSKRFVEKPTLPNEMQADPTIKAKLATEEWANAVFWVIMDAYTETVVEPAEVLEETKEWVPPEAAKFREVLEEGFVIDMTSTAADNYATSREIIDHIKAAGLNLSDTKIGIEMGKLGLEKIQKKIEGRNVKIYIGIKSV